MKFTKLFTFITIALFAAAGSLSGRDDSPILSDLQLRPLVFHLPTIESEDLPGGAVLIKSPDDSLPFMSIELNFPSGRNSETIAKAGTLATMARLIQIGGAGNRSAEEVAEKLSSLGAKFSVREDYEYWSVSMTLLKSDFDEAFSILSDILLRPEMPADRLEVIKNGMLSEIEQRNDDPAHAGGRKLREAMYTGLRRGFSMTPDAVRRIDIVSVRAVLSERLSPRGMTAAVSGDFRGLPLREKLSALVEAFPSKAEAPRPEDISYDSFINRNNKYRNKIILVEAPAAQTAIVFGGFLPAHNSADFYALQTANFILGGGDFNSRLMSEIRAKRGLAYYAASSNYFFSSFGELTESSATRTPAAVETLKLMISITAGMKNGASADEIDLARESILNGLIFQFDDPAEALQHHIRFRRHNMPADYLQSFPDRIRSVTEEDIKAASEKYYRADRFFIVVVGPASLKTELEKIRPVIKISAEEQL